MQLIKALPFHNFRINLPTTCKILLLFTLLESIAGGLSYHLAYFFSSSTPFNNLSIGLLGFSAGCGGLLGSAVASFVIGKTTARNIITSCFILAGLSFTLLPYIQAVIPACIATFCIGISTSLFLTANNTFILQVVKNETQSSTVTQSYKTALENAGCFICMILIMLFAQNHFKVLVSSLGLTLLILAIFSFRFISPEACKKTEKKSKLNKAIINKKKLLLLLLSVFSIGLTYGIQKTVLGIHLNETIKNSFTIGFLFLMDPLIIALCQVKAAKHFEKFNPYSIAALGCVIISIATLYLSLSSSLAEIVIALIIFTVGEMLFMPTSTILCHEAGSVNHDGLGIGSWRGAYALGMAIGPLLSGVLMHFISTQSAWVLSALLCMISASLSMLSRKA